MPADAVTYWLDLARYDLRAAKAMLRSNYRLYVGFLCHLAIEKTLKGYWAQQKQTIPPFTHDLSSLAERTGLLPLMDERSRAALEFLGPLYITARYPAQRARLLRLLTTNKCGWLLKETTRLHRWIERQLAKR